MQDAISRDGISGHRSEKHIGRKVRPRRETRKANRSSYAIGDIRQPAMLAVTSRKYRGNREAQNGRRQPPRRATYLSGRGRNWTAISAKRLHAQDRSLEAAILELIIVPDKADREARASLRSFRLA
jgi:hypothetical protein